MATRFVKSDTLSISVPHSCLRAGSDFESCSTSTSASRICAVWNLGGFRQSIRHSHRVLLDVYRKTSRRNVDHFCPLENVSNRQDNWWVSSRRQWETTVGHFAGSNKWLNADDPRVSSSRAWLTSSEILSPLLQESSSWWVTYASSPASRSEILSSPLDVLGSPSCAVFPGTAI
jgi:hypothetical protein